MTPWGKKTRVFLFSLYSTMIMRFQWWTICDSFSFSRFTVLYGMMPRVFSVWFSQTIMGMCLSREWWNGDLPGVFSLELHQQYKVRTLN